MYSRVDEILVEKCIAGWKEIEYEVMRDHKGNAITRPQSSRCWLCTA